MSNLTVYNKKILITGGMGFIGSYLVKQLIEHNEVTIVDFQEVMSSPLANFGLLNHPNLSINRLDITCSENLQKLSEDYDYIIHLAAILGVNKVACHPLQTMEVNGIGTLNMIRFASKQKNLDRFIFFSTSEIYGQNCSSANELGMAEVPLNGIRWNYSCSKLFGEYLLKAANVEMGIPFVIIRPFNVYGPYRKGANAMSILIQKALAGQEILINGDGTQSRAWCHVSDFVNGIVRSLVINQALGHSFNLGNDEQIISMYELAKNVVSLTHSPSRITILHNDTEEIFVRSPDLQKARDILGYCPKITLNQGIMDVADWLNGLIEEPQLRMA